MNENQHKIFHTPTLTESYRDNGKEEMVMCLLPFHKLFEDNNVKATEPYKLFTLADGYGNENQLFNPHNKKHIAFLPRAYAEHLFGTLQVIPYTMLVTQHNDGTHTVFGYHREETSGEQRLVGKHSLGFGGHVSLEDIQGAPYHLEYNIDKESDDFLKFSIYNTVSYAAAREISEETTFLDYADSTYPSEGDLLSIPFMEYCGAFKEAVTDGLTIAESEEPAIERVHQATLFHLGVFADNTTEVNAVHLCMANVMMIPSGFDNEEEFFADDNAKNFVDSSEDTLVIYPIKGGFEAVKDYVTSGQVEFEPWSVTLVEMVDAVLNADTQGTTVEKQP